MNYKPLVAPTNLRPEPPFFIRKNDTLKRSLRGFMGTRPGGVFGTCSVGITRERFSTPAHRRE
jgi:hypothetical protein